MVEDKLDEADSAADPGRARRAPPTIDLEATDISDDVKPEAGASRTESAGANEPQAHASSAEAPAADSRAISPWVIAPFSGAAAAALVIAVGWLLGWPQVVAPQVAAPPAAPQVNASVVDDLSTRVAALEGKLNKLDSTLVALAPGTLTAPLRKELAEVQAQTDKLAAAVNELKSAPHDSSAASGAVDLSAINQRIAELERASSKQESQIAQEGKRVAENKPADDLPLRRLVAATLLDVAVRHGDAYETSLATAKSLAPDPDALKPLDAFAATGIPNPAAMGRELLALVPKLSPSPPENAKAGSGIFDRLQSGASKLVHIERTDIVGNDRAAVVARATAAALRNDLAEARRELTTLADADRAPAQAWLDKAAERDAALAASRQLANEAMAALARPAQ